MPNEFSTAGLSRTTIEIIKLEGSATIRYLIPLLQGKGSTIRLSLRRYMSCQSHAN
jgi:hypothetical protein